MANPGVGKTLADQRARKAALTEHDRTLLVEAGAGSGKTALMAGRVAMLIAADVHPDQIVAITFTEAAAAELRERVEDYVRSLADGTIPMELASIIPGGLTEMQRDNVRRHIQNLDAITCTTIHGFCSQLIKPYAVETGQDPGATITDSSSADLAFQDVTREWLFEKFAAKPDKPGGDFLLELARWEPEKTIALIKMVGKFLKEHRTANAPKPRAGKKSSPGFRKAVEAFQAWYKKSRVTQLETVELIQDLLRVADLMEPLNGSPDASIIVRLLFNEKPSACRKNDYVFKASGLKGKWVTAAGAAGWKKEDRAGFSEAGEEFYQACGAAYEELCADLGDTAFRSLIPEFEELKQRYHNHKLNSALLDFNDLLHHARDLLRENEKVRQYLASRYPRILVDEFQDTDPLQAEILWLLAGESPKVVPKAVSKPVPWQDRIIRPGALFLVGDPKQAIYRFRGADVGTYLLAKQSLVTRDKDALLEITTNFRAQPGILDFVNENFKLLLDEAQGQPGFTDLSAHRPDSGQPSVQAFELKLGNRHKNDKGKLLSDEIRHEEARRVAGIVQRLIGSYPVGDKKDTPRRTTIAGDIALLAPTGTKLWIYERALESLGISIATQAGKGFYGRQEVQDLIAIARTLANPKDTLAFGAFIRGPLVGLSEEEIADEVYQLQSGQEAESGSESRHPLNLWTGIEKIKHPLLRQTLIGLQAIAKKARRTTPYLLMAEAVETFLIRPKLKSRHPHGAERALANIELVLEMARSFNVRGMPEFARMLMENWQETHPQVEGRPDEAADSVNILTMHSSKGLEWPIVIPINSMTLVESPDNFIYRGSDDTVHGKVFDFPNREQAEAKQAEAEEADREHIRLWYVALTRARDLLLLPRQSERVDKDWFSMLGLDLSALPALDVSKYKGMAPAPHAGIPNKQDAKVWGQEESIIAANLRKISWRQPSRHEGPTDDVEVVPEIYSDSESRSVNSLDPLGPEGPLAQGGMQRGTILHKLMEEILTGETEESPAALQARAAELIDQSGGKDEKDPSKGLSSREMAATISRTLNLAEIKKLRPRLLPEFWVYSSQVTGQSLTLSSGIADAITVTDTGRIDTVIDWKSDVNPSPAQVEKYFRQVRDYLAATGVSRGLIVFMSTGRIELI